MANYGMFNRDSFKMKDRIVGASRHSIQLKGDDGEKIFCSNRIFGQIMSNPNIMFDVEIVPGHEDLRSGRFFPETKWIRAYLPTRM